MMFRKLALMALGAVALAACGSEKINTPDADGKAHVRVLTGTKSTATVDLIVDGQPVVSGATFGQVSNEIHVAPGTHTVGFRKTGTAAVLLQKSYTFGADTSYTIVAFDSSDVINPGVLTDTGAIVAAGKTKLKVVHFAAAAPAIDVWRTQPDFATPTKVMFPFAYRAASSYIESTPGNWTVTVTAESAPNTSTSLYTTGAIAIPVGQSRTVVLLDATGGGITSITLDK